MLILHVEGARTNAAEHTIGRFSEQGGTIGRAADCTLVLDDPHKQVSRIAAEVRFTNGQFEIVNRSSTHDIVLNGKALNDNAGGPVRPGDIIVIAGFVLRAERVDHDPSIHHSWDQPETAAKSSATVNSSAPAQEASQLTEHELADLANQSVQAHRVDFEPLPQTRPTVLLDDLNRHALAAIRAVAAAGRASSDNGAAQPPDAAQAEPRQANEADALLQAFLLGAGLSELPQTDGRGLQASTLDAATMRRIGELLRLFALGTAELLSTRATARMMLEAHLTQVLPRNNNPLKFASGNEELLAQLLAKRPLRGAMDGPTAVREAFDDLRAHQAGMDAGMQAALQGLLKRFDPVALESRLEKQRLIERMLPANRKARLWELFCELAHELDDEARRDFATLYGREFLRAYEARILDLERPS